MVELTQMCGVHAKIELRDRNGNIVTLESGEDMVEQDKDTRGKLIVFTPGDVQNS